MPVVAFFIFIHPLSATVVPSVTLPFNQGVQGSHAHGLPVAACCECHIPAASFVAHTFKKEVEKAHRGAVLSVIFKSVVCPALQCISKPFPSV
jgi:hypothetical protein